jgi:hypothetical protein
VNVEISFNSQIAKIRRRVVILALHGIFLHASLLFLSIYALYLILKTAGITDFKAGGLWFVVSIGISLATALIISFKSRNRLLNILVGIDHRLKLQDRVSTAYEYLRKRNKNEFRELLLNDAAVRLRPFKMQQIMPVRFSLLHLTVILLLLINVLLYSGIIFTSDYDPNRQELQNIGNAGRMLNRFLTGTKNTRADRKAKTGSDYLKKLEQFSKKFTDRSKSIRQRSAALYSYLQEVQGEQARLAGELGTQLDSAGIKNLPVQNNPDLADLSASQLKKLKEVLDRALNNRMPGAISRNIESLQELDGIEKLLSRIIDNLNEEGTDTGDTLDAVRNESGTSQSTGTLDNPSDDPIEKHFNELFSDHDRSPANRIGKPAGKSQGNEKVPEDGMERSDEYSSSAGNATSRKEFKKSNEIAAASGTATQDKTAASPAKNYLIHIRAMTDIGEARLNEEEIIRSYRGEVEGILHKEDIPANYREYIKNYFISIGLTTEESAHGYK